MTTQTPMIERPPEMPSGLPTARQPGMPPPVWQLPAQTPAYGWQSPPATWQATSPLEPTAKQRLALAIVTLVFLVPLCAIAIGAIVPLAEATFAWIGVLVGLVALLMVCAAALGLNLIFNFDQLRSVRR